VEKSAYDWTSTQTILTMNIQLQYPTPWTSTFEENGGYDCMTDAFYIKDSNGELITVVDLSDFGQERCEPSEQATKIAKAVADLIVNSVNRNVIT